MKKNTLESAKTRFALKSAIDAYASARARDSATMSDWTGGLTTRALRRLNRALYRHERMIVDESKPKPKAR